MRKLKCHCCFRKKLRKHFVRNKPHGKHKSGERLPFGMCRLCINRCQGHTDYRGATTKKAYHRIPTFADVKRAYAAKHSRKLRAEKDPAYLRGINEARTKTITLAIIKLEKIQGNVCAWSNQPDKGECRFERTGRYGRIATPEFDHKLNDGRNEPYSDRYRIALIILKMKHPEERFQLLCSKHNIMKYRLEDPNYENDNLIRGKTYQNTIKQLLEEGTLIRNERGRLQHAST